MSRKNTYNTHKESVDRIYKYNYCLHYKYYFTNDKYNYLEGKVVKDICVNNKRYKKEIIYMARANNRRSRQEVEQTNNQEVNQTRV